MTPIKSPLNADRILAKGWFEWVIDVATQHEKIVNPTETIFSFDIDEGQQLLTEDRKSEIRKDWGRDHQRIAKVAVEMGPIPNGRRIKLILRR